jgi:hypothetical protein
MPEKPFTHEWQQLYGAVSILASSELPLRERLLDAATSRVVRIMPPGDHGTQLPPEIAERLLDLHVQLTRHGPFPTSISRMDDVQVRKCIEEIVGVFGMVAHAYSTAA